MNGSTEILRSYVRLLGRLSGAVAVSLYVPPGGEGEPEILVQDGQAGPLPELATAVSAADLERDFRAGHGVVEDGALRLASASPEGALYRIPLRWVIEPGDDEGTAPERRKGRSRAGADPAAWVGLRFESAEDADRDRDGLLRLPLADALGDDGWWKRFLGLAAAFAAHARTVSRALIDPVTGLAERAEFQAELEAVLVRARENGLPATLLLLGPDDFGWVNERLDRRAGDRVLREIGTGLRAGLRSQDHVARYGGAIFTAILRDTTVKDGLVAAQNVLRRLREHRYHGGALRLEFSAGLAAAEQGQPQDGQEMIRRADLALSAAKRGGAGGVRVWEKGSDVEHAGSLDRLQGIFTGDKAKDYRNMRLLLDSVAVVAASNDPSDLARSMTERLFDTLHAGRVGVLERSSDGGLELLGGLARGEAGLLAFEITASDRAIVERACQEGNFVAEPISGDAEASLCAMPLRLQDRCLGGIVLEVHSASVSFEGSDRRFLDALASEMAVALDRARLLERERSREHDEKARLEAEVKDLKRVLQGSRLAYRSAAIEAVLTAARKVARTDTTVLITGESGTGKEVMAHTLHGLSGRSERPLVVVDCSAISPTLIESELFGHERGAFTGAHARQPGRLAQADGATVFLDEIGDLPLDLQSKLLRFVQEKQFTPVGSVVPRRVDVRIIAATNADLRAKVAEGRFREDLFHRLNVVRLQLPPLRERRDDILHLANLFLQQFAALYRRPAHHFTPDAERAIEEYSWPGNVRELQNLVLTSVLFCDAAAVDVQDLQGLQTLPPSPLAAPAARPPVAVSPAPEAPPPPAAPVSDPTDRLRLALRHEISAALDRGRTAVPIGKWLLEDVVLTADRLAGGISRRGADLLGVPETTYRRQLAKAAERRDSGVSVRSPSWPGVAGLLEELIRERQPGTDVCEWAESCLLAEIDAFVPRNARTAAALLGVTEPTLLRRRASYRDSRQS